MSKTHTYNIAIFIPKSSLEDLRKKVDEGSIHESIDFFITIPSSSRHTRYFFVVSSIAITHDSCIVRGTRSSNDITNQCCVVYSYATRTGDLSVITGP